MSKDDKVLMGGVYEMQAVARQNGWADFGVNCVDSIPGSDAVNVQIRPMRPRALPQADKAQLLRDSAGDLADRLLRGDRKDDEELSRADVETLMRSGAVTVDELVASFMNELIDSFANIGEE